MTSPLSIHQELLSNYQNYLLKQFKSKNATVTQGRSDLYTSKGVTFQPPFLEFLFNYKTSGKDFRVENMAQELLPYFGNDQNKLNRFCQWCAAGIVPYQLYQHQWEMLYNATIKNKHSIITTGTGSGKTESFMLPLMAYLAKQLSNASQANYNLSLYRLTDNRAPKRVIGNQFQKLRLGEQRKPSVKAIMLFPMNALVEDQLKRIRNAFSSPDVLDILDNQYGGNRVFYGKYNGPTPGSGNESYVNNKGEREISKTIKDFYDKLNFNEAEIISYANSKHLQNPKRYNDALNYFGREVTEEGNRLTGEMLNRFDMQEYPPDILITNFSMLNVMLVRGIEQGIWDKTAEWLKEEDAVFHIILDELHLYRGSAGTEIAYTISALLERLGIADKPHKVKFLASSASLDRVNDQTRVDGFIGGFFNRTPQEIADTFHLEIGTQINFTDATEVLDRNVIRERFIAYSNFSQTLDNNLDKQIANSEFLKSLSEWYLSETGGKNRPCSIEDFTKWMISSFGIQCIVDEEVLNIVSSNPDTSKIVYQVVNGFFIYREIIDKIEIDGEKLQHLLPRIRMHQFYNNFEGLWNIITANGNNTANFGESFNFQKNIDQNGNKAYQLFYCEKCETSFLGGYKNTNASWVIPEDAGPFGATNNYYTRIISPSDKQLSSDSHKAVTTDTNFLKYKDFAIFWPEQQKENELYIQHIPETNPRDRITEGRYDSTANRGNGGVTTEANAYWIKAFFNPISGEIRIPTNSNAICPDNFIVGRQYIALDENLGDQIYDSRNQNIRNQIIQGLLDNESISAKALSQCCPACATKKNLSSIIRGYRTGFNKTNQLFASEFFNALKKYNPDSEKHPKLVSFSDSRDEAAKVSAGIEGEHFEQMITHYLLSKISKTSFTLEEKVGFIKSGCPIGVSDKIYEQINLVIETFDNILIEGRKLALLNQLMVALNLDDDKGEDLISCYNSYFNLANIPSSYSIQQLVGNFIYGKEITGLHQYLLEKGIDVRGVYNIKPNLDIPGSINSPLWFEPFKENGGINFGGDDNTIDKYYSNSLKFLKSYLLRFMFRNTGFEVETLGIGKLIPNISKPNGFPDQHWNSFIYGLVKLMGFENKYTPRLLRVDRRTFDDNTINSVQNLPGYINRYIDTFNQVNGINIDRAEILNLFSNNQVVLDFANDKCPVKIAPLLDDEELFQCNRCNQVYSHKIVRCFNCDNLFTEETNFSRVLTNVVRSKSYLGSLIKSKGANHRLHCEELSGQTDEPFERQRNFLGLIKDENLKKKAQEIDLLAVTTTLEVGVDIGDLQGMLMANMPPQRFNYQQRVGRVGRRGQAFSFAVTLCRSKSHDAHYFQHPDQITGDPSPTPFLNTDQPEILKRVLNKYFLNFFFREFSKLLNTSAQNDITNWHELFNVGDINGEFGKIYHTLPNPYIQDGQQTNNPESYREFIFNPDVQFVNELRIKYDSLLNSLRRNDIVFQMNFADYWNEIKGILTSFDQNKINPEANLGAALMELGYLPSYGMPTKVAYFYNNYPVGRAEDFQAPNNIPQTMDRTLEVAIFDYAPGSTKLKDKNYYTVKAIVPEVRQVNSYGQQTLWKSEGDYKRSEKEIYECSTPDCNYFELMDFDADKEHIAHDCPSCGNQTLLFSDKIAIEPRNFSVIPNDNTESDQLDVSSNNRLAVSGLKPIEWDTFPHKSNLRLDYQEAGNLSSNFIYKINKGIDNGIDLGSGRIIDNIKGLRMAPNVDPKQYWLYTRKNTDTLSFIVHNFYNLHFNLKVENDIHENLEKKAVFLSAATILQRSFADILDIDPREIEFANPEITTVSINGTIYKTFQLTFYDGHDNGSGYVRAIKKRLEEKNSLLELIGESKFFETLIHDDHNRFCSENSCYKCIRTYDNSALHGLLDWCMGLNLIKFMSDPNYLIDFNEIKIYVDRISRNMYSSEIFTDANQNSAIVLSKNGVNKYLITHPIGEFDFAAFKTANPEAEVEQKSIYGLILSS